VSVRVGEAARCDQDLIMSEIQQATVTAIRQLTPHVKEIDIQPVGEALNFQAGQWLSLRLPVGEKPPLNRAYSLALPPQPEGNLTLCFDRVEGGLGSGYLWEVVPGTVLEFTGPHGNFILPDVVEGNLLMVAHYTGIIPFRAMLRTLFPTEKQSPPDSKGYVVALIYSIPSAEEALYRDELRFLAQTHHNFQLTEVSPGEEAEAITALAAHFSGFTPYVCGLRPFTKPIREYLIEQFGLERRSVKLENFS